MKRFVVALAAPSLFAWCNAASADEIALSTWTGKKFQSADKDAIGVSSAGSTAMTAKRTMRRSSTRKSSSPAKKLDAYCGEHPTIGLITATDQLFKK